MIMATRPVAVRNVVRSGNQAGNTQEYGFFVFLQDSCTQNVSSCRITRGQLIHLESLVRIQEEWQEQCYQDSRLFGILHTAADPTRIPCTHKTDTVSVTMLLCYQWLPWLLTGTDTRSHVQHLDISLHLL